MTPTPMMILLLVVVVTALFVRDIVAAHRWKPELFHRGPVVLRAQSEISGSPSDLPEPANPVTFWAWKAEYKRLSPYEVAVFAKLSRLPLMAGLVRYEAHTGSVDLTGRLLWSVHVLLLVVFGVVPMPWGLFIVFLIYTLLVYFGERHLFLKVFRATLQAYARG